MKLNVLVLCTGWLFSYGPLRADDALLHSQWRAVFDGVAAEYNRTKPDGHSLQLVPSATYTWARSGPHRGTYGAVYVWTDRGNAEAVGCFWRYPLAEEKVSTVHELHSLSPAVLHSNGKEGHAWTTNAGLKRSGASSRSAASRQT